MKRRDVLRLGASSALILLPAIGCAQAGPSPVATPAPEQGAETLESIAFSSSVERNHGHSVPLTATAVLKLLRQTKTTSFVTIDIQGSSGHPHALELTHQELLTLVIDGILIKDSTEGAAHSHSVGLRLDLK
ncbi:MAG: hypothetical protein V4760_16380 [Bdellovibrionota bacterium]